MKNEKENEIKCEKLCGFDVALAVLYLVIIVIGVMMCVNHGLGGTLYHLVALTASVWGVLAMKILKYRNDIKGHIGEFVFIAVMCLLSVLTLVGTLM